MSYMSMNAVALAGQWARTSAMLAGGEYRDTVDEPWLVNRLLEMERAAKARGLDLEWIANDCDGLIRQRRVEKLVWTLVLGLIAFAVAWALAYSTSLPHVYQSADTGLCTRVDDPTGVYSCEHMPTKYHHHWSV